MNWLAELDGRRVAAEVPATSANLGAGYDCLGLALGLVDRIDLEVRYAHGQVELVVEGEGAVEGEPAGELPGGRDNRFVAALERVLEQVRGALPPTLGWGIRMTNAIPLARGLGSSAAGTVGGLLAANALLGEPLGVMELLGLAAELEGHPDNAAAALLGGFVVVDGTSGPPTTIRFDAPRDLRAVLFIPELRLSTAEMRAVLPEVVPLGDAIANLSRVAVGVAGLAAGRTDMLGSLTTDRLHEPYRAAVYPQLPRLVAAARQAGALGACLSGAGSTIIAFSDSMATITRIEGAFLAVAGDEDFAGRVEVVMPRNAGARVVAAG